MNLFEATATASKPRVLRAALVLGLLAVLLGLGAQVATQARGRLSRQPRPSRTRSARRGGSVQIAS